MRFERRVNSKFCGTNGLLLTHMANLQHKKMPLIMASFQAAYNDSQPLFFTVKYT